MARDVDVVTAVKLAEGKSGEVDTGAEAEPGFGFLSYRGMQGTGAGYAKSDNGRLKVSQDCIAAYSTFRRHSGWAFPAQEPEIRGFAAGYEFGKATATPPTPEKPAAGALKARGRNEMAAEIVRFLEALGYETDPGQDVTGNIQKALAAAKQEADLDPLTMILQGAEALAKRAETNQGESGALRERIGTLETQLAEAEADRKDAARWRQARELFGSGGN